MSSRQMGDGAATNDMFSTGVAFDNHTLSDRKCVQSSTGESYRRLFKQISNNFYSFYKNDLLIKHCNEINGIAAVKKNLLSYSLLWRLQLNGPHFCVLVSVSTAFNVLGLQ